MSLDKVIDAFEDAWQRGGRPDIDSHLPADQDRLPALVELVHIDLERRLKSGEDVRVESYLHRYPELTDTSILVELAAAEFQFRRRRDPAIGVDEYSQRFPQLNGAISGFTLPAPPPSTLPHPGDAAAERTGPVVTESSYAELRPHARGGLGEIFVARDGVLNREVALKFLRHRRDREGLDRFLREAEITGRLEHPGVVPVYGLGRDAAGNPVYAMRFIRGSTLQEAIDRYHAESPKLRSGPRRLAFRDLLTRFLSVCNTVAYAHTRGVIHRDLKPGNILLGEFGETLVVDWGLAKTVGSRQPAVGSENNPTVGSHEPSSLPTAYCLLPTVEGDVVGTPAYMSPEQAGGEVDRVGTASDIYSLGAVLYTLLTGRSPFAASGVRETLEKVRRGEFAPPGAVNRRLPKPLEAICLKAMANDPARRYGTAMDLARDLERWLASEPVSAWREPMIVTARRWLGRHPTLVTSGSVALIALALLAIVTAVWRAEHADRRLAQLQTEQDRRELSRHDAEEYLNRVTQAGRAWLKGDRTALVRHLDACKPELRQWEWHHLRRQAAVDPRVLRGHSKEAWALAYSPDGTRLTSAGLDGAVHVWDSNTGAKLFTLPTKGEPVYAVAFHPDGTRLATGGDDCVVRVWDLQSKKEVASFEMQVEIGDVAFSLDGKRLAASTMPGRAARRREIGPGHVTVWDLASGAEVATLRGHSSGIHSIAFAPDGRLATAGLALPRVDGLTQIWEIGRKEPVHKLRVDEYSILRVSFSPDGARLATAHSDGAILIWDTKSGELLSTLFGHNATAWGAAFSPDNNWLVTSSDDQTLRVWDMKRSRVAQVLRGHARGIASVAWRPDGKQIASASDDGTVRLWAPENPGAMHVLGGHSDKVQGIVVSDDGHLAASAGDDGAIRVWDLNSSADALTIREKDRFTCVDFHGDLLAYAGTDGAVRVWNTRTRQQERRWPAHGAAVWSVAFSSDGEWLATASADNTVRIWRASNGELMRTLKGHEAQVNHVRFSPDGRWIATAGADKTLRVWSAATGDLRHKLGGFTSPVLCVAFGSDGRTLAAGSDQAQRVFTGEPGQIRLFDVSSGEELSTWPGHFGGVTALAFSADGRRLFSGGGGDGNIKVWDRASAQELLTLPAHTGTGRGPVRLALANGALLSSGPDGNVIRWNAGRP